MSSSAQCVHEHDCRETVSCRRRGCARGGGRGGGRLRDRSASYWKTERSQESCQLGTSRRLRGRGSLRLGNPTKLSPELRSMGHVTSAIWHPLLISSRVQVCTGTACGPPVRSEHRAIHSCRNNSSGCGRLAAEEAGRHSCCSFRFVIRGRFPLEDARAAPRRVQLSSAASLKRPGSWKSESSQRCSG